MASLGVGLGFWGARWAVLRVLVLLGLIQLFFLGGGKKLESFRVWICTGP